MILYLFITALTVTMAFFVNSAYVGQQNNRSGRERQRFLNLLLVVGIMYSMTKVVYLDAT